MASALRRPERTTEKVARASTSVPNAVAAEAAVSQLMEATVAHAVIDVSCHRRPELKTLYLLRHAKSSWDDQSLADHDRPLAPRGKRRPAAWRATMRRAKVRPQLVLCSSAARALQTYEAVSAGLGPSVPGLVEDELYGASDSDLRVRLHEVPDTVEALLVIGHNPGLQDLALGWPVTGTSRPWPGSGTSSRRAPSPLWT